VEQLGAAGVRFFRVMQKTTPLDQFQVTGVRYYIQVAAPDTTGNASFDTLVFFDAAIGILPT
jgi:hypothetical protein